MMNVLIRERRERLVTQRYENSHVKILVETEVIHLKAREYQRPPAPHKARSKALNRFFLKSSRSKQPSDNLISDFCPPDYERTNFCCSYH